MIRDDKSVHSFHQRNLIETKKRNTKLQFTCLGVPPVIHHLLARIPRTEFRRQIEASSGGIPA